MINFGLGDVVKYYRQTYSILPKEQKELVKSLIKSIVFCVILVHLLVQLRQKHGSPFPSLVSEQGWEFVYWILEIAVVLTTGVIAALLFTLFDRIGVITPIEKDIKTIMERNKEEAAQLSGYIKSTKALKDFGLSGMMATTSDDSATKMHIDEAKMDRAVIALFDKCETGSSIDYMNSFVNSDQEYYDAILRAVQRGVNFHLMLMLPDARAPAVQSRFKDYQIPNCKVVEDFVAYIKPKYFHFDSIKNKATRMRKQKRTTTGNFDIRYYSDSLNFPLIIVNHRGGDKSETIAYTGFYAGVSSESMPYIEWRRGEVDMVATFESLFLKKWQACHGKDHIFKRNEPIT